MTAAQSSSLVTSSGSNLRRGADGIDDLPAFVLQHVGDHHLGAFAREHARRRRPHAGCRAGDDGDLARESHGCLSFCFPGGIVSQLLGSAQRSEESAQFMYESRALREREVPATRYHEPPLDIVAPFGRIARRRTIAPETARRRDAVRGAVAGDLLRPSFRFLPKNECVVFTFTVSGCPV
jgi:hypothetical protein